jgi:hypothetical protein
MVFGLWHGVAWADISIIGGPQVRIPGITAATVVQVTGVSGFPLRWWLNGGGVVGEGSIYNATVAGTYTVEKNLSTVPENPFWVHVGTITIPALEQSIQINGPSRLNPGVTTQLCHTGNAGAYVVARNWFRNSLEETTYAGSTCRNVLYPGTYYVRASYQYGQQVVSINTAVVVINSATTVPVMTVSRNSYDPVSPPPVLTVANSASYTQMRFMRDGTVVSTQSSPHYEVGRPGRYIVSGLLSSGFWVYTDDITITRGSLPAPVVSSDGNFELSYSNPDLRLSTAVNYGAGYTWYHNNQAITDASSSLVVTSPGVYKVRACATYPDGQTECKTSADNTVLRNALPTPPLYAARTELTYDSPEITLYTTDYGAQANYTWYYNNQPVPTRTGYATTIREPGIYAVMVCVTYPDGVTSCGTSPQREIIGQTVFVNLVRTRKARVENLTDPAQLENAAVGAVAVSTLYSDGFARPLQQVSKEQSPDGNDVVSFFAYDALNRSPHKYLPFVRQTQHGQYIHQSPGNPVLLQRFYRDTTDAVTDTEYPFARTVFEAALHSRVLEQGAPGEAWQPGSQHTVRFNYTSNNQAADVRIWKEQNEELISASTYATGRLDLKETIDENGFVHRVFTDLEGREVMREEPGENDEKLRTYFVYDDLGRLHYIIPPKALKNMGTTAPFVINYETVETLCYRFEYDGRGRMITKAIPGAGAVHMLYDPWDRVVLTQTTTQRERHVWSFIKYNSHDQPIITGEMPLAQDYVDVRAAMNTFYQNAANNPTLRYEAAGTAMHGYTNRSYPTLTQATQAQVITYFDDYAFLTAFGSAYNFVHEPDLGDVEPFTRVRGVETGKKVLVLGTSEYLKTVNYYNKRYKLIQTISGNYLGGTDRTSSLYDFSGNLVKEWTVHHGNTMVKVRKQYTRDHASRLLKYHHQINDGANVLLAQNHFNALGELTEKNIHSTDGTQFLQSVDYRYNIRGWLTTMNRPERVAESNVSYQDLYAFQLSYNEFANPSDLDYQPAYNGNITAFTETRPFGESIFKSTYTYTYDRRNQLRQGKYYELSNRLRDGYYNLENLTYDDNGNILTLRRKGVVDGAPTAIDDLNYHYYGNQLNAVDELGSTTEGFIKK